MAQLIDGVRHGDGAVADAVEQAAEAVFVQLPGLPCERLGTAVYHP